MGKIRRLEACLCHVRESNLGAPGLHWMQSNSTSQAVGTTNVSTGLV